MGAELGIEVRVRPYAFAPSTTCSLENTPVTQHAFAGSTRNDARAAVTLPARLTWKDASGAVRFTSVKARQLSETGAVIECDGAAYHSSRFARDRDRLRQQVLESFGWKICRI